MSEIGIVGAGHLGAVLAKRLVAAGHAVKVANSRGSGSLAGFAVKTGARPVTLTEAADGVEVLILAIPFGRVSDLPPSLMAALPAEATVIDAGNYYPPRDGRIAEIEAGMPETAWVAARLGAPVVRAFNNITDHSLAQPGRSREAPQRVALPVSGDDPARRATAMRLVESLGFDAVDAGPLAQSWRQGVGQAAYCTDPTRAELERMLARADERTVASKREGAIKIGAKLPDDFPKADLTRVARLMAGLDRLSPAAWWSLLRLATVTLKKRVPSPGV